MAATLGLRVKTKEEADAKTGVLVKPMTQEFARKTASRRVWAKTGTRGGALLGS